MSAQGAGGGPGRAGGPSGRSPTNSSFFSRRTSATTCPSTHALRSGWFPAQYTSKPRCARALAVRRRQRHAALAGSQEAAPRTGDVGVGGEPVDVGDEQLHVRPEERVQPEQRDRQRRNRHQAVARTCGDVGVMRRCWGVFARVSRTPQLDPQPHPTPAPASSCLVLPHPAPAIASSCPCPCSCPAHALSPPVFVFVFFACTRPQGWQREGDGTGYCCSPPGPLRPRPKAPRNWGLNSPPGPAFFSPSLSPNARRGR